MKKIKRRFTPLESPSNQSCDSYSKEYAKKNIQADRLLKFPKKKFQKTGFLTGFTIKKREQAERFVENRLNYFNKFYNFKINRVTVRNQGTRWGSCSSKGNLNFNYKIIYLRPALADYLIAHELCHLRELNHSKRFWALVAKTIPDYVEINKELKRTPVKFI